MKRVIITIAILALLSISAMGARISAYLITPSTSISNVKYKLKENGFSILGINNNVITITNKELQRTNTYLATLQVYVGAAEIRIQNPVYFAMAYLDDYKKGQLTVTVSSLTQAFGSLKKSSEHLDASALYHYRFMPGMPYFDEPISVSKLENIYTKVVGNRNILYTLPLPNGSLLVGHKLSTGTNGFLKRLNQTKNSQILPYEALVFTNEVKMMHPKFYLALSLPQLRKNQFMKISDIPDKIERDIKNAYR